MSKVTYSAEDEALRRELREWLAANLPLGWADQEFVPREDDFDQQMEFQRRWHHKLHAGGWAGADWPKEYGGRGLTPVQRRIVHEEMTRHKAPEPLGFMGLTMVAPTLMQFGTKEQQARYIPKIQTGEEIWCQGYSEPNSGSDLASIRTRAIEDGDDFVINGQKIWTSFARQADWMFLLARTDPEAPKHRGISYLLLDMKTPGITVRPLKTITGGAHFNEVFFDNVRFPKQNLVGEQNRGWYVGVATLAYERSIFSDTVPITQLLEALVRLAKATRRNGGSAWEDLAIRHEIADLRVRIAQIETLDRRIFETQLRGAVPGNEAPMAKVLNSETEQRLAGLAQRILGPYGPLTPGSAHVRAGGNWAYQYLWCRATSIYSGTNEIQRNIIAERGLGLPR